MNQIKMPMGRGVKRSRINRGDSFQSASFYKGCSSTRGG
jgi:hypothetical protein